MVFKRRDKRPMGEVARDFFWPKGGWVRAFRYVNHRLRRLPDPPHRIARGVFAGIFVTFSPFFGLHFLGAAILAWIMRGNIIASLLATFVGNPLTFPLIAVTSFQTGHFLLGLAHPRQEDVRTNLMVKFVNAGRDFKDNFMALFTKDVAHWDELGIFYDQVFFPYMVGGIIPGLIAGMIGYYVTLPLIIAYQNRRKGRLKAKLADLREKAAAKAKTVKK